MNILTDVLSLFKRKKFATEAGPNDVLVLGINEEPEMTGIASPIPYKSVKLIKIKDFKIAAEHCDHVNVPAIPASNSAGVYQKTEVDKETQKCTVSFRTLKSLSTNLTISTSLDNDYVEFTTTGEPNTAANVGVGVGVWKDKVGETLNFKSLTSNDGSVTITQLADTINLAAASGGGGTMSSFIIGGDAGTNQVVVDGSIVDIEGGTGINTEGASGTKVLVNLTDTAVVPGTYTNSTVTVNAQGQITNAASGSGGGGSTQDTIASGHAFMAVNADRLSWPNMTNDNYITYGTEVVRGVSTTSPYLNNWTDGEYNTSSAISWYINDLPGYSSIPLNKILAVGDKIKLSYLFSINRYDPNLPIKPKTFLGHFKCSDMANAGGKWAVQDVQNDTTLTTFSNNGATISCGETIVTLTTPIDEAGYAAFGFSFDNIQTEDEISITWSIHTIKN